jgi:ribosomal protein S12 methylthiotransferase accessory factor
VTTLLEERPFTPVAEAIRRLESAVSPIAGIIVRTARTTHTPDETSLPHWWCELASARRTLGAATVDFGAGSHPSDLRAHAAALGEAVERYSGTFVPDGRVRVATARELGASAVDPEDFSLFHPLQHAEEGFPFVPFTGDTRTHFVEGESLRDGSPAFLPAELVYLRPPLPALRPIAYSTSSGLACAPTPIEAVLGGLFEVIERDAVMLTWSNRLSLPLLDWHHDDATEAIDRRFFAPTGLRYAVLDASAFMDIPTAISVVHGPRDSGAALALGAACAADVREAWVKALSESFGVYRWLRQRAARGEGRSLRALRPEDVQSFDDHMLYYACEAHAEHASFLDASAETRRIDTIPALTGGSPAEQVGTILERLGRGGVSAYAVDITAPDVCALGLSVVRVIAPELCPLDVSHTARFLGGRRPYHAAHELGLRDSPLGHDDVNPYPHPFP